VSPTAILIVSEQPLVAALLAMLVELAGHRPECALPSERLDDSLQRAPVARIALLDEMHPAAGSDLFFARAARRGVSVILFGSSRRRDALARLAAARSVRSIELPLDSAALGRVIEAASRGQQQRDRRRPEVERTAAGHVIYHDREGARWYVYDRRVGSDRRRADRGDTQRLFLNDAGEMWRFLLEGGEDADASHAPPEALERQLARAERVCVVN
jgi:hypothetical protein